MPINHQMILGTALPAGGGGFDADADAFLIASGNDGDATIVAATHELVIALKDEGIWAKCNAIYPIVGGTAAKHKWNLKDPQDTDAAFRLTFTGTWTHSANGMVNNGGYPAFADTKLTPSTTLTLNNTHLAIYARNNVNGGDDIGAQGSGNGRVMYMSIRSGGNFDTVLGQTSSGGENITVANADSAGFYVTSRRSVSDHEAYKNGASIGTLGATSTGALPQTTLFIGDRNFQGAGLGNTCTRQYAFASIGSGLTDAEVAAYNAIVEEFQDALSRGVV